jgi:hypothetical protein
MDWFLVTQEASKHFNYLRATDRNKWKRNPRGTINLTGRSDPTVTEVHPVSQVGEVGHRRSLLRNVGF